jgi:hypothetical protein
MAVFPTPASPTKTGLFFGSAAQDLDDPLNFHLPTDDGVQFPFNRQLRQVTAEGV